MRRLHTFACALLLAPALVASGCSKDSDNSEDSPFDPAGDDNLVIDQEPGNEDGEPTDDAPAPIDEGTVPETGDENTEAPIAPALLPAPPEGSERFVIPFTATVNDMPLVCGQEYAGIGLEGSTIEVRDFRLYVHDVALIDASGARTPLNLDENGPFQLRYEKQDGGQGGLALIDFTDKSSELCSDRGTEEVNTFISGVAPEGDYTRMAFSLGVPPELNHVNAAVSEAPLNVYGMQWTWASGYRHIKVDIQATTPREGEEPKVKDKYYFHPGAQGCATDNGEIAGDYRCDNELNMHVEMDLAQGQAVQADLARLYASSNLSLGRGCMGGRTLNDIAGDGFGVDPTDGCPELYAAFGLQLPEVLAAVAETLGTCSDDAALSCSDSNQCGATGSCEGYAAALQATPAIDILQTVFSAAAFAGDPYLGLAPPALSELRDTDPLGWPHPDYARNKALDISSLSAPERMDSHPPGDMRYGTNCMKCHQANGPGESQYVIAGTLYEDDNSPFVGGGKVEIGTGTGNRFGPKTHPILDKIRSWQPLFEVPIDQNGQFYVSADNAVGLDYDKDNYFARIVGAQGSCKTATGNEVLDTDGKAVSCEDDSACSSLSYDVPGTCLDASSAPITMFGQPVSCSVAGDCGVDGATCDGFSGGNMPVCDKVLGAMAIEPHGACNHCHQGDSFKLKRTSHL